MTWEKFIVNLTKLIGRTLTEKSLGTCRGTITGAKHENGYLTIKVTDVDPGPKGWEMKQFEVGVNTEFAHPPIEKDGAVRFSIPYYGSVVIE